MANGADLTLVLSLVSTSVEWLDRHNGRGDQEISLRVLKVAEEAGEAVAAWIGVLGQNPRKGVTHQRDAVVAELCDTAITALVAAASLGADTAYGAELIIEVASGHRGPAQDWEITNRLLFLAAQCGKAAEVRSEGRRLETQIQWLRIAAGVALSAVAELGFDPAEALTAKARAVSARIAEHQAAEVAR